MQELYVKLADILDVDVVKPEAVLREFETWDSLSALSIIAMASSAFGVTLSGDDLRQIKTAGALEAYLATNREK